MMHQVLPEIMVPEVESEMVPEVVPEVPVEAPPGPAGAEAETTGAEGAA